MALALGTPLSVTRTTMAFVLGPCDSSGVQENNPVTASMVAPVGAPASRLNVSDWTGKSLSDALTVKLTVLFSGNVCGTSGWTIGGLLTLLTVTLNALLSV